MNRHGLLTTLITIQSLFLFCQEMKAAQLSLYSPNNPKIRYTGRIDFSDPKKPRLSGAGCYFQLNFQGSACELLLQDENLWGNHNYMVAVIDGKYQGRIRLDKDQTNYPIAKDLQDTVHSLFVCKATEAQIGYVDFLGISCGEILPPGEQPVRKIEFIGNSITCGMGLELSDLPCDSGAWYDQHNAYLAYGPLVARELDADWRLSSVSGIGMTRNWNSDGPTMPDVYQHIFLDTSSALWDAKTYSPDLVSICLGTNDFSDGDGTYQRALLDSAKFISDYIGFVKFIRSRYPKAQICFLTSPVFSEEKDARLKRYLSTIMARMQKVKKDEKIHLFDFSGHYHKGCTGHPNREEHEMMAKELLPFYKKVMAW